MANIPGVAPRAAQGLNGDQALSALRQLSPADMQELERLLKKAGFLDKAKADGNIGPGTVKALMDFQQAAGVGSVKGFLDQGTVSALQNVDVRGQVHQPGTVGVGQKSDKIKRIERDLKRLGYDVGKVDGTFDGKTAEAVKEFKQDQQAIRRWASSSLLGPGGQQLLKREIKALDHKPRTVEREETKRTKAEDRLVSMRAKRGIAEGDSGEAVKIVQRHLKAAGFNPKSTGGDFDERTAGMVKELQRKSGLEPTGVVNARTWNALSKVTVEDGGAQSRNIMKRAREIGGQINSTGGYRFDGVNDCWGFVRRVWDPVLGKNKLPVADAGTAAGRANWDKITDWSKVPVGTPLSTHEGHAWGPQWHGGLFAGMKNGVPMIYDCSGSRDGCYLRPMPPGLLQYFYKPAAQKLG